MTPHRVTSSQPTQTDVDHSTSKNVDGPDSEAAIAAAYAAMAADPETHLSYEHVRRRRQQHAHHYIDSYKDEPDTQLPPQDPTMTDQPDDSARGTTEPSAPPTGSSTSAKSAASTPPCGGR